MDKICEHKHKKALSSNKLPDSNLVTIFCIDCEKTRYENRYSSGRIDYSEWFEYTGKK